MSFINTIYRLYNKLLREIHSLAFLYKTTDNENTLTEKVSFLSLILKKKSYPENKLIYHFAQDY
ncbi:hypothetical protein M093_3341 [Bacteroides uniformis str. 3978 T3 i]|nr:hypothetical protein M093_3341 [Bacteroides uniformis str. 3978 T3 i]